MTKAIHNRFIEVAHGLGPNLAEAITLSGPVKLKPRRETPLAELLCRAVAGQQLSVKAASTIWGRVVDSAGEIDLIDHIAAAKPQTLRSCGMSAAKVKAMKAITRANSAGQFDLAELDAMDHEARSSRLTEVWGVGQWTADMIGISYFGDKDIWPESDVTVWKTLERLTSRRRKTLLTASHFAPHRTYLALYMWKIADTNTVTEST